MRLKALHRRCEKCRTVSGVKNDPLLRKIPLISEPCSQVAVSLRLERKKVANKRDSPIALSPANVFVPSVSLIIYSHRLLMI